MEEKILKNMLQETTLSENEKKIIDFDPRIKKVINLTLKEVLKLIDEDIAYQKKQLIKDYKKDKSINWRIIGMESLKKKILGK